jgi:hypothetical protein
LGGRHRPERRWSPHFYLANHLGALRAARAYGSLTVAGAAALISEKRDLKRFFVDLNHLIAVFLHLIHLNVFVFVFNSFNYRFFLFKSFNYKFLGI